jgi:hypothetical protein
MRIDKFRIGDDTMNDARAKRILDRSRELVQPIEFEPRPHVDPQDDPLVRYQQRQQAEAEVVRKAFADEGESEAAGAAVRAAQWDAWLRGMLEADRRALLEVIGEFVGDQLAEMRAAFEKNLDRQRRLFETELKATTAELRSRVTEIAGEMRAARIALDTEIRAQCTAVRLEGIDRCQALVDRLQVALGERQAPVIEGDAERLRRAN